MMQPTVVKDEFVLMLKWMIKKTWVLYLEILYWYAPIDSCH